MALNSVMKKEAYPIPRVDVILDALAQSKVFSTLDATTGYYQTAIDEQSREKTAFQWKGRHYEFTRLHFGLCNAPATFQRAMDKIFEKERGSYVIPCLHDIIIYSKNP